MDYTDYTLPADADYDRLVAQEEAETERHDVAMNAHYEAIKSMIESGNINELWGYCDARNVELIEFVRVHLELGEPLYNEVVSVFIAREDYHIHAADLAANIVELFGE